MWDETPSIEQEGRVGAPPDEEKTTRDQVPVLGREQATPPPVLKRPDEPPAPKRDKDSGGEDVLEVNSGLLHKRDEAAERDQINSLLSEKQNPFVRLLSEAELQDVHETFVAPDDFPDMGLCLSHHILIIRGNEESGKYTAARYLAYELLRGGHIENVYHIFDNVGMSLRTLIRRYPKSLLIMRDAFSTENALFFRSMTGLGGQKVGTCGERRVLLDTLDQYYNPEELRDLCMGLGVDYHNLGGEGMRAKALSLIEHLKNRARVAELIKMGKETRPHVNWGPAYDLTARLQTDLRTSSSYLIFTVYDDNMTAGRKKRIPQILDLFSAENVPEYRHTPPDLYQVFVKHLQARLGKTGAETWLKQYGAAVAEAHPQWKQPGQAVDMARSALPPGEEQSAQVQARLIKVSVSRDIDTEVADFFKELNDECKLLALNLSLLTSWPESDFWHMHRQLIPSFLEDTSRAASKKKRKKKKKKKRKKASIFGTPKAELLEDIRAHVTPVPVQLAREKHIISHIEFKKEEYPLKTLDYVKRNHPEFLEDMITHLVALAVETEDKRAIRIAATEGIGLLSRVRWPLVETTLQEWANHKALYVRAMAGHVLSKAYTDPETRVYTTQVLRKWAESDVPEWQWTAASTYKEMRWIDLDFGLDGLERMAYRLDLSPLKVLIPYESHWRLLDEEHFREYILRQAGVSLRRTSLEARAIEEKKYRVNAREKEATWANIKPVFDAIAFAVVVTALDDFLKDIICRLSKWINKAEDSKKTTIQLAGSLIWLRLADIVAEVADEEKVENGILELISHDADALDVVAEVLSGSLVQLFPIQLANHRKSFEICLLLEQWAAITKYIDTMPQLLHRMEAHLVAHPKVHRYVKQLLRKRWQSKRMSKNIRKLGLAITQ